MSSCLCLVGGGVLCHSFIMVYLKCEFKQYFFGNEGKRRAKTKPASSNKESVHGFEEYNAMFSSKVFHNVF